MEGVSASTDSRYPSHFENEIQGENNTHSNTEEPSVLAAALFEKNTDICMKKVHSPSRRQALANGLPEVSATGGHRILVNQLLILFFGESKAFLSQGKCFLEG